jgi:hypothetical protein
MIACDKGDDQPMLNTALLFGKQWQLNKILVNENRQEFEDPISTCHQDDALEFKSDKIFIRYNGKDKCNQEADSEVSQWSIFQEPKTLIFENIEYQILNLNATNLDLQRNLQGADGDVIVKYFYISL